MKYISIQDLPWATKDYINQTEAIRLQLEACPDWPHIQPFLGHPDVVEGRAPRQTARFTIAVIKRLLKDKGRFAMTTEDLLEQYRQAISSGCRNLTAAEKRVVNDSHHFLFSFGHTF